MIEVASWALHTFEARFPVTVAVNAATFLVLLRSGSN